MVGTVTVASKLPWSLRLQLQVEATRYEQTFGGGSREVQSFVKGGKEVVIAGCAFDRSEPSEKHLSGGYALTHGVDAEFWTTWCEQHKGKPGVGELIDKGLLFAVEKPRDAETEAKSNAGIASGFEPVDPNNLPDEFKAHDGAAMVKVA